MIPALPQELVMLMQTVFVYGLILVACTGGLALLGAIIMSFFDNLEARRQVMKIFSNIIIAVCAAFIIVIILQILVPIVDPVGNFHKLTQPTFYQR